MKITLHRPKNLILCNNNSQLLSIFLNGLKIAEISPGSSQDIYFDEIGAILSAGFEFKFPFANYKLYPNPDNCPACLLCSNEYFLMHDDQNHCFDVTLNYFSQLDFIGLRYLPIFGKEALIICKNI